MTNFLQQIGSKLFNSLINMNTPIIPFQTFQPSKEVMDFIKEWKLQTTSSFYARNTYDIRNKKAQFQKDCFLSLILLHGKASNRLFCPKSELQFYENCKTTLMDNNDWKFTEMELRDWARHIKAERDDWNITEIVPFSFLLKKIKLLILEKGKTKLLLETLADLKISNPFQKTDFEEINQKIDTIINGIGLPSFLEADTFGIHLNQFIATIPANEQEKWLPFLAQLFCTTKKATPEKKWVRLIQENTANLDAILLLKFIKSSVRFVKESFAKAIKEKRSYWLYQDNEGVFCGIIWLAGRLNDVQLHQDIEDIAIKNWQNYLHPCLYAISCMELKSAIPRLSKIKQKIKKPSILKKVDKFILEYGKEMGKSGEEMEEIGVPDFGLIRENGKVVLKKEFAEVKMAFEVKGAESFVWKWLQAPKKASDTEWTVSARVPMQVAKNQKDALAQLKLEVKEMESVLKTQRKRMEEMFLEKRAWKMKDFDLVYMQNPLLYVLSSHLIWQVQEGEKVKNVFFYQEKWQDENLQMVDWITEDSLVSLWHPIESSAAHIFQWRSLFLELEITQPFSQAFREVYIVTDAELKTDTYSNRFAAHLIRQSLFSFLCKHKNWKYSWEITNKELKKWNMRAEFWTPIDYNSPATTDYGFHEYHHTDQVRFYQEGKQLKMSDVPAIVFSEIMREVDYFIGNTSIGADPNWQSGVGSYGYDYSQAYSFADLGEAAKNRKEILKALIPRLKIAAQCSFDGKFLIVKGKIRTYKIHIGSGNILMTPNDQYLCIVADRSQNNNANQVRLPFEGDAMLSIILSKAFLLADDTSITDTTITSQINRR